MMTTAIRPIDEELSRLHMPVETAEDDVEVRYDGFGEEWETAWPCTRGAPIVSIPHRRESQGRFEITTIVL